MTGNLDQLSEEELESRMKQILDDNKLITVEPSPSSESHQEENIPIRKYLIILIVRTKGPQMLFIFLVYIGLSYHSTRHEPIELIHIAWAASPVMSTHLIL